MMKGEKGITLIALVITIIVMLILVAVTVSFAVNGGLFSKANTASDDTRMAQINEAIALTKADLYTDYYDPTNLSTTATISGKTKSGVLTTYKAAAPASASDDTVKAVVDRINYYLDSVDEDPVGPNTLKVKLATTNGYTAGVFKFEQDGTVKLGENPMKTIDCDFWHN